MIQLVEGLTNLLNIFSKLVINENSRKNKVKEGQQIIMIVVSFDVDPVKDRDLESVMKLHGKDIDFYATDIKVNT